MKVCYGIDISGEQPVAVRAERTRGRVSSAVVSRDQIDMGAHCVGSLSVRESFTRWLETPFGAESKARKVLPTLLDIQLPFPLEDCTYDFLSVAKEENSVKALAVGATMDAVGARIDEYQKLGFDVRVLDQDGVALWAAGLVELPQSELDPDQPRIVVHLGKERSTLVLGTGMNFLSSHSVRSDDGGRICRLLDVGLKGTDVSRVRWVFTGEAAEDPDSVASFLALAGDRGSCGHEVVKNPAVFLARALAVRGLDDSAICNLRSGDYTHADIHLALKRKAYMPAAIAILAGVLLIAANLTVMALLDRKEKNLDASFRKLADKVAGYRVAARGKDALSKVQRKVDERAVQVRPFLMAFDASLTAVLREIMQVGGAGGLKYDVVSVATGDGEISEVFIRGTAANWNDCDALTVALRRQGCSVAVDRREALSDERIPFTLRSAVMK